MKYKNLVLALIATPVITLAQGSINQRLAEIFELGFVVSSFIVHSKQELNKVYKISIGDEKQLAQDRAFCFIPRSKYIEFNLDFMLNALTAYNSLDHNAKVEYPKGKVAYNEWPAKFFLNSSDPRCDKFKIDTYKDDPGMNKRMLMEIPREELASGYVPNLPQIRARYTQDLVLNTHFLPELKKTFLAAVNRLESKAKDKSISPFERSLAIAARNILLKNAEVKQVTSEVLHRSRLGNKDVSEFRLEFMENKIKQYEDTMAYLAFVAADNLNDTDWDLSFYREFNLEIDVRSLNQKVDKAMAMAAEALYSTKLIQKELKAEEVRAMIRSALFWGVAGVYAKTFLPR